MACSSRRCSSIVLYFLEDFFALLSLTFDSRSRRTAVLQPCGFWSSSSLRANISRAFFRFCSWDREYWHVTTVPVGIWVSWTLLLLLLIFWPPGPLPPFRNTSLISSSTISHFGRGGSSFFLRSLKRWPEVDIWRRLPQKCLNRSITSIVELSKPACTYISVKMHVIFPFWANVHVPRIIISSLRFLHPISCLSNEAMYSVPRSFQEKNPKTTRLMKSQRRSGLLFLNFVSIPSSFTETNSEKTCWSKTTFCA